MPLKRGNQVNYTPDNDHETFAGALNGFPYGKVPYPPVSGTFVWAVSEHLGVAYVIEHPEGHEKSYFLAKKPFADGFESIKSNLLDDSKKYIYADENELKLV